MDEDLPVRSVDNNGVNSCYSIHFRLIFFRFYLVVSPKSVIFADENNIFGLTLNKNDYEKFNSVCRYYPVGCKLQQ